MIVIGIDQSYTKTGVALVKDDTVLKYKTLSFKGCKNKTDKRKTVHRFLLKVIKDALDVRSEPSEPIIIICERIRTYTGGFGLRPKYLISTGALIATIVDTAYEFDIEVFSVDTRAWKSQIVGKANKGKDEDSKTETIKFVKEKLGIDVSYLNKKGEICYEDDTADAICIGLYGFVSNGKQNLKKEE